MPDENTQDNSEQANTEEMPSLEYILENWISIKESAKIMRLAESSVSRLCKDKAIRSKKIGNRWYIDPYSAHSHKKWQHKRKD